MVVVLVEECNAFELIFLNTCVVLCIVKKSKDELQIFFKKFIIFFYFLVLARWVEDHC